MVLNDQTTNSPVSQFIISGAKVLKINELDKEKVLKIKNLPHFNDARGVLMNLKNSRWC